MARVILFKTAEGLVPNAPWYDGGYRAQIVAYSLARLAKLARDASDGGTIDWSKIGLGSRLTTCSVIRC